MRCMDFSQNMIIRWWKEYRLLPKYVDKEKFMCDKCPSVFVQKHWLKTHNDNVHHYYEKSGEYTSVYKDHFCVLIVAQNPLFRMPHWDNS